MFVDFGKYFALSDTDAFRKSIIFNYVLIYRKTDKSGPYWTMM